jgi:hypothetical protein
MMMITTPATTPYAMERKNSTKTKIMNPLHPMSSYRDCKKEKKKTARRISHLRRVNPPNILGILVWTDTLLAQQTRETVGLGVELSVGEVLILELDGDRGGRLLGLSFDKLV